MKMNIQVVILNLLILMIVHRFLVPKTRGTVIVFDSRTPHRVTPVESGIRKSLVGWVVGKRWR